MDNAPLILLAAGGVVLDPQGELLTYGNAAASYLVPGFVAWGDAAAAARFGARSRKP